VSCQPFLGFLEVPHIRLEAKNNARFALLPQDRNSLQERKLNRGKFVGLPYYYGACNLQPQACD